MKKYSPQAAIRRRHAAKRISENARCVIDNFGIKYRITRSRRVLAIFNFVSGKWESPSAEINKGITRMKLHSPHHYLFPNTFVQPSYDTRPEQPSFV